MGGKVWSKEEEELFWTKLVPHSPKRLGEDLVNNEEQSWDWIGEQMTQRMGDQARRKYTYLCVFEHYFQNAYLGRFSPKVGKLHLKYYHDEQAKKKMKEQLVKTEMAAPDSDDDDVGDSSRARRIKSGRSATETSGARIKVEPEGTECNPIELCQYPTTRFHPEPAPTVQVSMPPAPPTVAAPAFQPTAQYYFAPFAANHDRLGSAGGEEDSLFVTQSPGPWVDGGVAQGFGYHHGAGTGHEAF